METLINLGYIGIILSILYAILWVDWKYFTSKQIERDPHEDFPEGE